MRNIQQALRKYDFNDLSDSDLSEYAECCSVASGSIECALTLLGRFLFRVNDAVTCGEEQEEDNIYLASLVAGNLPQLGGILAANAELARRALAERQYAALKKGVHHA